MLASICPQGQDLQKISLAASLTPGGNYMRHFGITTKSLRIRTLEIPRHQLRLAVSYESHLADSIGIRARIPNLQLYVSH